MAIDYTIDYPCAPKDNLTSEGITQRLKDEARAKAIIKLFRDAGDDRPPSQMGFEFTRNTPDGTEETRVVIVQTLLDAAEDLRVWEPACSTCPANLAKKPFGCFGQIEYPLSGKGEAWLLDRMPPPDDTLVWLLLKQGVEEFQYDGEEVKKLRTASDAYFEDRLAAVRSLGEFMLDANQTFEMLFVLKGSAIYPNHAAIMLLFTDSIDRQVEADEIVKLTPAPPDAETRFAFKHQPQPDDDATTVQLKQFLHALWYGWTLNTRVLIDS
ncbi:MAG: hypothetical protein MUF38_14440 [Anaerolineae bacterium]|nr:hypothetical protein [Anaerolineae bacterium]